MDEKTREKEKKTFKENLRAFSESLREYVSTENKQWTIKGFIDVYKSIYLISGDTKLISKIIEIHLFPKIASFATQEGYAIIPASEQNWYPDFTFIKNGNEEVKFAVDLKTTYREDEYPGFCNGFTLGSHGEYFTNRASHKNVQFPYGEYLSHLCLGVIYTRNSIARTGERETKKIEDLESITSVISNLQFFVAEKWLIASDIAGSGNTANIGSISKIEDILNENGVFKKAGEDIFDEYWMNYGKIMKKGKKRVGETITNIGDYLEYRGMSRELVNPKARRCKSKD